MTITLGKATAIKLLPFLGLLILFVLFLSKNPGWFWVDAWFLFEIAVITALTRTLSLKQGVIAFLMGIFIGFGLIFIIGSFLDIIGISQELRSFIIPPVEEILKFAPFFLIVPIFGGWKSPRLNLSDFLFIGAFAGGGFGMIEKYFWDNVVIPYTYGPHIGDLYLFSDALGVYVRGEMFGYVGHAAATMFLAIGIGMSYMWLRKKHRYWYLPALIAFLWISIEHIILNYYYTPGGSAVMWFAGGLWTPWIILIVMIFVITTDLRQIILLLQQAPKLKKKLIDVFKSVKDLPTCVRMCSYLRAANYLAWLKKDKHYG